MAKKKAEIDAKPETKATSKPKAAAKKAEKPAAATQPSSLPMIDTNLAAAAAANFIARKNVSTDNKVGGLAQIKNSLNKAGPLGGPMGLVGKLKNNQPGHVSNKQVGRNQTFNADITRAGVPRRTGGG